MVMGKCKMGIRNAYFNILGATYARGGGSQPKWILFFVHTHMLMYKHYIWDSLLFLILSYRHFFFLPYFYS